MLTRKHTLFATDEFKTCPQSDDGVSFSDIDRLSIDPARAVVTIFRRLVQFPLIPLCE